MRAVLVVAVVAGCGRFGFDPVAGGDAIAGDDAVDGSVSGSRARLSIGDTHACAIIDGALWCWGANTLGAVGTGTFTSAERSPVRVGTDTDWQEVCAADDHTCGIRAGGDLFCWGENAQGNLGQGLDMGNIGSPEPVGSGWTSVACKQNQSCALRVDGTIRCWGANDRGEIGVPSLTIERVPLPVGIGTGWQRIHVGLNYVLALGPAGVAFWGSNEEGQAGGGSVGGADLPPQILPLGFTPVAIAVGNEHSCTVDGTALLRCWGDNRAGEIGNGLIQGGDEPTPYIVSLAGKPEVIAAGGYTSCAVTAAGELYCWGDNLLGQLGLGDKGVGTERLVPTRVGTDNDWISIVLGKGVACGTRPSGTYCWGNNASGVLGIGSTAMTSPVPSGPLVF